MQEPQVTPTWIRGESQQQSTTWIQGSSQIRDRTMVIFDMFEDIAACD
jgi:hypothetical protein